MNNDLDLATVLRELEPYLMSVERLSSNRGFGVKTHIEHDGGGFMLQIVEAQSCACNLDTALRMAHYKVMQEAQR